MLPLVAMYENQVIPKGIKHISSIKQEKPSKVINNQHNLQTNPIIVGLIDPNKKEININQIN